MDIMVIHHGDSCLMVEEDLVGEVEEEEEEGEEEEEVGEEEEDTE
jgi:hypothetical protein